jgi:hypothetical protein
MRLETIDEGSWAIAPHDLRVLAMVGAHIQHNRNLTRPAEKCSDKPLLAADGVVAIILDAEATQGEIEQQIIQPAVSRRPKAPRVGSAEAISS